MKIVLATGIYPPEIGGPSVYAERLKNALEQSGHTVVLVLYGSLKQFPTGIRHIFYAAKLWAHARQADAIIALDTFSVALPAAFVAFLTGKRTVVRAGGDFVWEQYIERTKDFLPLPLFYEHMGRWSAKEQYEFFLIKLALSRVEIAFSTEWQQAIWQKAYGFDARKTRVIENAIDAKLEHMPHTKKNFLFFARNIALKNREAFRRAFARVQAKYPEIVLEEGTLSHEELLKKMQRAYAVVVPSISEVSPNVIIESIQRGKPFLLTKYSAYAERFAGFGEIVDPLSEDDMARGIESLSTDAAYAAYRAKIDSFSEERTYTTIAREYTSLLQGI